MNKRIKFLWMILSVISIGLASEKKNPEESKEISDVESLRELSFRNALQSQMPLTAENVTELHKRLNDLQQASQEERVKDPKFLSHLQTVSLEPGSSVPCVYAEAGYVTSLSVIDVTGQPWPVKNYVIGNPKQFDVQGPLSEGHILMISPLRRYGSSNLSVTLEGLATPVQFILRSGKDKVHTRYDARIGRSGPQAKAPLVQTTQTYESSDETMMTFLQGVPPGGAQRYRVRGSDEIGAWHYQKKMYVRSPYILLSPAPEARASSSDGMAVYRLSGVPVLVFSREGSLLKIRLDEERGQS